MESTADLNCDTWHLYDILLKVVIWLVVENKTKSNFIVLFFKFIFFQSVQNMVINKKRKICDWQYLHSTLTMTWLFTKNQQTLCFLSERFFFSWFIWINVTISSGVSPYDNCFHWFKSKCSWFVSWLAL